MRTGITLVCLTAAFAGCTGTPAVPTAFPAIEARVARLEQRADLDLNSGG